MKLSASAGQEAENLDLAREAYMDLSTGNAAGRSQVEVILACILCSKQSAEAFQRTLEPMLLKVPENAFHYSKYLTATIL